MFRSSDRRPTDPADVSLERLAGRVQLLAERVDTLAQTVASTAASIAKKDGEIAVLRRELEGGLARVEAHATGAGSSGDSKEIRELRERVAALARERPQASDEGRIAKLDAKVAYLAERIDTLATTVAATAAGLAGREGEIAALRRRLDEDVPRSSGGADPAFRKRIDDLGAATASASMRLESHSTQIAALRDALDARQDTLESALALLAERVEAAERERAALATSVAEAAGTRWGELERTLASLGERIDALERDRTATASELTRATSLWPAALRSLEARVAELVRAPEQSRPEIGIDTSPPPSAAATWGSEASPQSAQDVHRFLAEIRALERRLESSDAASRQEREELRSRVQRLEASGGVCAEDERLPVGADVLPFRGVET